MKISIIVPVYNVEKYIRKCIMSICNQKMKEIEILVINDGTLDNSIEIIKEIKDSRIRIINKENGGLSSARNIGIENAKGEYIAFVDSDDWIDSNMYSQLYRIASDNNCDIVQCGFIKAYEESEEECSYKNESVYILDNIEMLGNFYNERYIESVVTWNKIYKRELFNNIRFPEGKLHEDEFTTHKLIYKANKIAVVDMDFYYYRQTPNSIMNSKFNFRRLDILEALEQRLDFMKKINNEDLYLKTLEKYEFLLRKMYFLCKKEIKDNKQLLKLIRKKQYSILNIYLFNKHISVRSKAGFIIFLINYKLYTIIRGEFIQNY